MNLLQQNNHESNKFCYSSFLGEKDEQKLEELEDSLSSDKEFSEIFEELRLRKNINSSFQNLDNNKKVEFLIKTFYIIKSEKDYIIDEYWKIKEEMSKLSEKQDSIINLQIEKYKNEAYNYKCERDEIKMQIANVKTIKDRLVKEKEKMNLKIEKYKKQAEELREHLNRFEQEKREERSCLHQELEDCDAKYQKLRQELMNQADNCKELENYNETLSIRHEELKTKFEIITNQNKELNEKIYKLEKIYTHQSNASVNNSGIPLDGLLVTEMGSNNKSLYHDKPDEFVVSMKVNLPKLSNFQKNSQMKPNSDSNKKEKYAIRINKQTKYDPNRLSNLILENSELEEESLMIDESYSLAGTEREHLTTEDVRVKSTEGNQPGDLNNRAFNNHSTIHDYDSEYQSMNTNEKPLDTKTSKFDTKNDFMSEFSHNEMQSNNQIQMHTIYDSENIKY